MGIRHIRPHVRKSASCWAIAILRSRICLHRSTTAIAIEWCVVSRSESTTSRLTAGSKSTRKLLLRLLLLLLLRLLVLSSLVVSRTTHTNGTGSDAAWGLDA